MNEATAVPAGRLRKRKDRLFGSRSTQRGLDSEAMPALKARVHNGRLVLDEPTDLPEGQEVELVPVDDVLAGGGDYLDDEQRAALHRELKASVAEAKAGHLVDADAVIAGLLGRRSG